jgi:putative transposase
VPINNYLEAHPDAFLTEIASEFGCHPTAIHYALKAIGYTRKKSCTYYRQDPEKVNQFLKEFNNLSHLTHVYIDETGFETYFHRIWSIFERSVDHWSGLWKKIPAAIFSRRSYKQ